MKGWGLMHLWVPTSLAGRVLRTYDQEGEQEGSEKEGGKTGKERRSMRVGRVVCIAFWKSWELSRVCCVI